MNAAELPASGLTAPPVHHPHSPTVTCFSIGIASPRLLSDKLSVSARDGTALSSLVSADIAGSAIVSAVVTVVQLPRPKMDSFLDQPSAFVGEPVRCGKRRVIPAEVPVEREMRPAGRGETGIGHDLGVDEALGEQVRFATRCQL